MSLNRLDPDIDPTKGMGRFQLNETLDLLAAALRRRLNVVDTEDSTFSWRTPSGQEIKTPKLTPRGAVVKRDANQAVLTSTNSPISFDGILLDSGGFFSPGAPTRITFPEAGVYAVSGTVVFEPNALGNRIGNVQVYKSSGVAQTDQAGLESSLANTVANSSTKQASDIFLVDAGDYIQLEAYQTSGATRQVTYARLSVFRVV